MNGIYGLIIGIIIGLVWGVSLGIDLHAWALKKRLERLNGEEKALHREV